MKYFLSAIIIIVIFALISENTFADNSKSKETSKASQTVKKKKKDMDLSKKHLKLNYQWDNSTISKQYVSGTIHNRSTNITYKNLILKVSYFTKTNSLLREWNNTIYEFVPPGASIPFRFELGKPPDLMEIVRVDVVTAEKVK